METTIRRTSNISKKPDQRAKELKTIDKSNWKTVTFGEVCRNVNESESNPLEKGLERFIGLEHIESGSLHITKWGNIADGTTFTKRFAMGNVLFGKRRAYLKKAAIAEFDGLCSGDILVFEPITKKIHPDLFPFLVSSDKFFDYAVKTSAGSLSPRTKFKDLANFEFLLPPLEEQARLAELLWAGDEVLVSVIGILQKISAIKSNLLASLTPKKELEKKDHTTHKSTEIGNIPKTWTIVRQGDVAKFYNGRAYKLSEWENEGVPVIRLQNLTGTGEDYYYSNLKLPNHQYCDQGDLLYMWSATFGAVIWKGKKAIYHYHIWKIECDETQLDKQFMFYNLEEITRRMMLQTNGSTMLHITKGGMEDLKIALPPLKEQRIFRNRMGNIDLLIESTNKQKEQFTKIQKQLINQIFS